MFYDKYVALCAKKGITPSAAAKEIGINKAAVSNWKYRKNGPSDVTMQKIADYFGVPVSELTEETKKAPAPEGERNISDDDIKFALFGGDGEITDAMYDEVKRFAKMVKLREEADKKKE